MQRRSGTNLVKTAIDVDPFEGRVQGNGFAHVTFNQFRWIAHCSACLCILKSFVRASTSTRPDTSFG